MTLDEFCEACLIPSEGSPIDPHPRDVADFISEVIVGERRGVSEARVASLHFPIFALLLIIYREVFDWTMGEWITQLTRPCYFAPCSLHR
jgi:hypothetical protein